MGSSNSYCNSGGSTLVKGTIKQSPGNSSATRDETKQEKKLVSGSGFTKIQESIELMFELSSKETYLRKTLFKRTGWFTKEKVGEEIYVLVDEVIARKALKKMGGTWTAIKEGAIGNKVVFEHVDSSSFLTGWYRVRKKIIYSDGNYAYEYKYYKREGGRF